jgi:hypothetical protein
MLLFLDESYEANETSGYRLAYAGFGVDEHNYRGLVAAVYQAKCRFIGRPVPGDDTATQELGKSMLVRDASPERAEIKANQLMGRRQVKRLHEHGFSPGLALVDCMLDALREADATVFGVLAAPNDIRDVLNPSAQLPIEHIRLYERVEMWMKEQHPDKMVSIIPDTIENYKHNLSACLADFLFRSAVGKGMRHIVVTPFWVDSSLTVGAQLADIVAYVLMNGMRPSTIQIPLDTQWRKVAALEFRSMDMETRGIRKVRRK